MSRRSLSVALAVAFLGGCASLPQDGLPQDGAVRGRRPITCADRSYSATLDDGRAARGIAEASLAATLKDTRGDMLRAGLTRLRTELKPTRCEALGQEIHCQATGSVCGH